VRWVARDELYPQKFRFDRVLAFCIVESNHE
jgi:hypothetical protein